MRSAARCRFRWELTVQYGEDSGPWANCAGDSAWKMAWVNRKGTVIWKLSIFLAYFSGEHILERLEPLQLPAQKQLYESQAACRAAGREEVQAFVRAQQTEPKWSQIIVDCREAPKEPA